MGDGLAELDFPGEHVGQPGGVFRPKLPCERAAAKVGIDHQYVHVPDLGEDHREVGGCDGLPLEGDTAGDRDTIVLAQGGVAQQPRSNRTILLDDGGGAVVNSHHGGVDVPVGHRIHRGGRATGSPGGCAGANGQSLRPEPVRAAGHVMVRHGGRHVDRGGAGRTILRETEAQLLVALSLGFLQCVCDATHTFTRELTLEAVSFVRLQVERHVAA